MWGFWYDKSSRLEFIPFGESRRYELADSEMEKRCIADMVDTCQLQ